MQNLWSRVASPRSACHCVSCSSTAAPGVASRAASAASKRRLRIGNSVTALYTSIFAAATLADAQAKDKRRHEWQEKIAAVKAEVNELKNEEQRLLAAISLRRKRRLLFNGILPSRRYSSSLTRSSPRGSQGNSWNIPARSLHLYTSRGYEPGAESEIMDGIENYFDTEDEIDNAALEELVAENEDSIRDEGIAEYEFDFSQHDDLPDWLKGDPVRLHALRKLANKQLAIRFLLRPVIAHSYMGLRMRYAADSTLPKLNLAELLSELNKIRMRIRDLKTIQDTNIDDLTKDFRVRDSRAMFLENSKLDLELRGDVLRYINGTTSLQELLLRVASNLLKSTHPDRPHALRTLLLAFCKTRQNDLGDLVMKAILPNYFPLNIRLTHVILTFYRKAKNLRAFDLFLEMLTGRGYPLNMALMKKYHFEVINGVEISLPREITGTVPFFNTMITAYLRFDQPDRADAYRQVARSRGYADDFATLNAYLKFYAIRANWEKGVQTIKSGLAFLISSPELEFILVERLIVLMVHLCDSCKRYDVSEVIIAAASENGIDWMSAQRQADIKFPYDPELCRWYDAGNASTTKGEDKSICDRCHDFAHAVGEQLNDLALPEKDGSARRWHKLVGAYSQEVLSVALAGRQKESEGNTQQQLLKTFDIEEDRFYHAETTAKAHQKEIMALKDQVAQLKRMVFELAKQAPANHSDLPQSDPNDLGQLKNALRPTTPHVLESPRVNVRYVQS
ncbi:hypothetical protein BDV28DRAFT_139234 [Aspergillus coremiiformis]|uniref:Uncharacterized protein n=1 Tax=Aspergillus coremiiformis TaxID=138285 RepID=A0A5N6YY52_9EURO|nr:hypothetical protein BDV28DRAFT_139234 [Aspergillus coremiiformis]